MARLNESWFEFNGMKSSDMDVRMRDTHAFSRGAARGSQKNVAGRPGYVWNGDGATEALEVKRTCRAPASRLREISAWLCGAGGLRFSQEDDAMYDARIVKAIEYKRAIPGDDPLYEFSVTFSCQPFPRLWPEAEPVVVTVSGTELRNPGTAPARPRIEIVGSGSFTLMIGKQVMTFADVDGGIIVDGELGDAFTADGALLANEHIDGELFQIQPGLNTVSWHLGGADGEPDSAGRIEKITITPRWRYR